MSGTFRIALADDSDIFGNNIAPNVMLLLDSSQSMNDDAGTLVPYASATTYTAMVYRGSTIDGTKVYKKVTARELQRAQLQHFKSMLPRLCK